MENVLPAVEASLGLMPHGSQKSRQVSETILWRTAGRRLSTPDRGDPEEEELGTDSEVFK